MHQDLTEEDKEVFKAATPSPVFFQKVCVCTMPQPLAPE
jgi:hypothetical protein